MRKLLIFALLICSSFSFAERQDVYLHNGGIDTSIYNQPRAQPNFSGMDGMVKRVREKREARKLAERQSQYSVDLLDATQGLKEINMEVIRPLIQKYPEKSVELLDLLKNTNK